MQGSGIGFIVTLAQKFQEDAHLETSGQWDETFDCSHLNHMITVPPELGVRGQRKMVTAPVEATWNWKDGSPEERLNPLIQKERRGNVWQAKSQ